jgi:hypothetical protein
MPERNAVVAVYSTHEGAEDAVKELQRSGIDMRTLSIVGKGTRTDEHVRGYYTSGDRMKYWGRPGPIGVVFEDCCSAPPPSQYPESAPF